MKKAVIGVEYIWLNGGEKRDVIWKEVLFKDG